MVSYSSWGLRIGRVAGIEVRLHWTLLLFWLWRLDDVLRRDGAQLRNVLLMAWVIGAVLLLLSILLHELGHCFAARRVGGSADQILLWPLGGLAFCRCPYTWRANLVVAAGGPTVTLVLVLLSYVGFLIADQVVRFPLGEISTAQVAYAQARHVLISWNLLILIFNSIPLYPMDGGRMLHSFLWGYFSTGASQPWSGHARANRMTLLVSRVTAVAGITYAVVWPAQPNLLLVGLFVWLLLGAESLRR